MTISADALRDLHRIHRQLTDLRSRLARGPQQIKAGEGNVARLETDHAAAKEVITRARVASDEKQLQLKGREDRITDLQTKLNTANSNKEFQALKEQIAADEQANSVLSDEILETLEKIDELQVGLAAVDAELKNARSELEKVRARVAGKQAALETELVRVTNELEQAESKLEGDLKVTYLRIAKARGEDALAEVEGECCGSCHQTLPPQIMNELALGKPVFCKSCGALMYLPE